MDAQICRSTREIEADVNKEQSLFRRIQTLFRFLCEHLHKEELELRKLKSNSDHRTLAKGVFGFTNSVINKCTKGHVTKKDTLYFQTSLQLPKDTVGKTSRSSCRSPSCRRRIRAGATLQHLRPHDPEEDREPRSAGDQLQHQEPAAAAVLRLRPRRLPGSRPKSS